MCLEAWSWLPCTSGGVEATVADACLAARDLRLDNLFPPDSLYPNLTVDCRNIVTLQFLTIILILQIIIVTVRLLILCKGITN